MIAKDDTQTNPSDTQAFATKMTAMKKIINRIFNRGSRRCIIELVGKNCPIVMDFIK